MTSFVTTLRRFTPSKQWARTSFSRAPSARLRLMHQFIASVVGLVVLLAAPRPSYAIPIAGDYLLTSQVLTGTFTSTGTDITTWRFTTVPFGLIFAPEFNDVPVRFGVPSYDPTTDTLIGGQKQ
jgi:hypothetical protein